MEREVLQLTVSPSAEGHKVILGAKDRPTGWDHELLGFLRNLQKGEDYRAFGWGVAKNGIGARNAVGLTRMFEFIEVTFEFL